MENNLHVSYNLHRPDQNQEDVIERIKQLGSWAQVHASLWYVNSGYSAPHAVEHITPALDPNDRLYVVDSTNNVAAWNSLPKTAAEHIREQWYR